ncbi:MAG: type VI secretion system baseplate subunit TssK [Planctomycetes bacterium]|nr:type VI secretion system baseplate subunit TssK [Planctomycetota bacterium]
MSTRAVHWHEGLFLRPHHLQASHRHTEHQSRQLADTLSPYAWGCRVLDIDPDALANWRFQVRRLRARLPDGTAVDIPEDTALPPLDLKPGLERGPKLTVYLAVPVLQLGRPNATESETGSALSRYRLDSQDLEDENAADDREAVVVRRLNAQLLTSGQDFAGYSVLPLAKIVRSSRADGRPEFEAGYIPPVLGCDTWPALSRDILQAIYDRVGTKIDVLAGQVLDRGLAFEGGNQADVMIGAQLRALNELYALLAGLAFTSGLHPVMAYIELCRGVGQLSLFGPSRRPPPLPRYDHDDIGGSLYFLKRSIDSLLDVFVEPDYKSRPFVGAGLRMEVALEAAWVESTWQIFIAVQSTLSGDELIRVLTQPGVLDMKVGSSERVDAVFRDGREGLRFTPVRAVPRTLPHPTGVTYFQLATDATAAEWAAVQKSLSLAVRLNENLIAGSIHGQRDLTVQVAGKTPTLRFTLYVVPRKSLSAGDLVV